MSIVQIKDEKGKNIMKFGLIVAATLVISCCLALPCHAQGGGAALYEVGTPDMGLSGAGAGKR